MTDGLDLTDRVKGQNQYLLRFETPAAKLKGTKLSWRTVCQCNVATIPRLQDGENKVTFLASGRGLTSAGPTLPQAQAHVVDGAMNSKAVTLELASPRGERPAHVYAAAWVASGSPPDPAIKFQIEFSTDAGNTWSPVVKDWQIVRRQPEPPDFWSQSFCWGDVALPKGTKGPVRVRFRNDGGRNYRKVEAHLAYEVAKPSPTNVTFAWTEGGAGTVKTASKTFAQKPGTEDKGWTIGAGKNVATKWVEYATK